MQEKQALVVGVSGIVGLHTTQKLLKDGWGVVGISRRKPEFLPKHDKLRHLAVDLLNREESLAELKEQTKGVTLVFYATWVKKDTEEENCEANGQMLTNLLDGVLAAGSKLKRVILVTGTKHYLGPFSAYGKVEVVTPFKESQPRLPFVNFYYTWEDILMSYAKAHGFTYTVARPHTIIGFAPGNMMNLGTTVSVYASICKEQGLPFVFPGSKLQYEGLADVTDVDLLAEHLVWSATNEDCANEAFNVVNGDVFRWKQLWAKIATFFGLEAAPHPGEPQPLEKAMAGKDQEWEEMVKKYDLKAYKLSEIASWWHTDADLGRTLECVNSMNKSKKLGFVGWRDTEDSFLSLCQYLRDNKYIP